MYKKTIASIIKTLLHPRKLQVVLRDLLKLSNTRYDDRIHLDAAMDWLKRSQDSSESGGCAASYGLSYGWAEPYPETTGYIISTFLAYSSLTKDMSYAERAIRMGDWELEIQLSNGAVRGGVGINDYPIVFNTGMVILGWVDLYKHTMLVRYLDAAKRAADWLCSGIEEDGRWIKDSYNKIPHAYHSRVAWSLLEVYALTNDHKYLSAAGKNIRWVLSLVQDNGWIKGMGFSEEKEPFTHTVAYTLRGLIECSRFFPGEEKKKIHKIVLNAVDQILGLLSNSRLVHPDGSRMLPGTIDDKWGSSASFSCLTGNAQLAIILLKIYHLNGIHPYKEAASALIRQLKCFQNIRSTNSGINGGIAGSYPIWGSYMQFAFPNWAAKFFADAIMLKMY